jgi:hypothetical protein
MSLITLQDTKQTYKNQYLVNWEARWWIADSPNHEALINLNEGGN